MNTIYLDYQSTSPVDPRVLDTMLPYLTIRFGNAHSRSHNYGWESSISVNNARKSVARLINSSPDEIIFTSGATESNNLTIKGLSSFYKEKKHIITTQIEHKCILNSCRYMENKGYKVTYLPVNKKGIIDLQKLYNTITKDTLLFSCIFVHNEIGVIQPIKKIGEICKKKNIFFHTDASQAFGKVPINVKDMKIDIMSFSGHKIYGPKGIGGLYLRKKPRIRLTPLLSGGGQERGIRSGTLSVPLIVGMGKAAELAKDEMDYDNKYINKLCERFLNKLKSNLDYIYVNGDYINRYKGCLNISFEFIEGESLMMAINDIAVSSGSACTSASLEPSYVLQSLGIREDLAHSSIRIGFGRFTTINDIDRAAELLIKAVKKLRDLSPLYEMKKNGIDFNKVSWAKH